MFWKTLNEKEQIVQCQLCPHFCVLKPDEVGKCKVRKNISGELNSLVYAKPISVNLDPIEKKPLYHFLPGEKSLSVATQGCNFSCEHCQNWEISQLPFGAYHIETISPGEIVNKAKEKAKIISYTFTEPTVFYEYMLDIAKIAKKSNIKNTTVTNGFINPEPLTQLCHYLDGSNIDLKSIDNEFYKKICNGRLKPVLDSIKLMKQKGVWIEITNLLIPGYNDSESEIKKLVNWVLENLGENVPIHFTGFYPTYKMGDVDETKIEKLKQAYDIAKNSGINFVYTGNLPDNEGNNTYCPKCNELLIKRNNFQLIENKLKNGKCECGEKIPGVWK